LIVCNQNPEVFCLNENNHWELDEYNSMGSYLFIKAIDEKVAISEIYEWTNIVG